VRRAAGIYAILLVLCGCAFDSATRATDEPFVDCIGDACISPAPADEPPTDCKGDECAVCGDNVCEGGEGFGCTDCCVEGCSACQTGTTCCKESQQEGNQTCREGCGACHFDCAGGSNCGADCQQNTNCYFGCQNTSNCELRCRDGATCVTDCKSTSNCTVACERDSRCDVDCEGTSNCNVNCTGSARCVVKNCIGDACNVNCPGSEVAFLCPDGVTRACNLADCPQP
jgi:hypothetical protein